MKIAIISDTHDNVWKIDQAMPYMRSADVVIHCGDLCSPFVVKRLGEGLKDTPVHIVWGNNEGDRFTISKVALGYPQVVLHGPFAKLEIGGLRVAVNHYPEIARGLALSREFDLVCYGHDHTAHEETVGGCLLLNPGELMGLNGYSTLALLDPSSREVTWVNL